MNYENIKLIALDLDETTLNKAGQLTERTENAVKSAIQKGIHIVIASGRAYTALPKEVLAIEGVDYAITSNGAVIFKVGGECIYQCKIAPASVGGVLSVKNDYNITYEVFIDGVAYADSAYIKDPTAFGAPIEAKHYLETTRNPIDDIQAFMRENATKLDSIDIVVSGTQMRDEIAKRVRESDSEIYVTSSVPYLVEVSYKDAGKGSALKRLCAMLNIPLESCVAFGNADNDIDMLTECGLGVAVANATPNCIACADMVAPHHNEDGVAVTIEKFLQKL